jgi:hypothetical protein
MAGGTSARTRGTVFLFITPFVGDGYSPDLEGFLAALATQGSPSHFVGQKVISVAMGTDKGDGHVEPPETTD